jgi:hypothetical protein
LSVQKRRKIQKSLKTTARLSKPVLSTGAPPVIIKIAYIKTKLAALALAATLKRKKTKTQQTKVFGRPTTKPIIRAPVVLDSISTSRAQRKRIDGYVKLSKPAGKRTAKVKPVGPRILSAISIARAQRRRIDGSIK